jgi:hypothetical protein
MVEGLRENGKRAIFAGIIECFAEIYSVACYSLKNTSEVGAGG